MFRGCTTVLLLCVSACDYVWRIDRLERDAAEAPEADADPDGPADAAIDTVGDAPSVLTCATSPIVLLPTGTITSAWTDQIPTTGTHFGSGR